MIWDCGLWIEEYQRRARQEACNKLPSLSGRG